MPLKIPATLTHLMALAVLAALPTSAFAVESYSPLELMDAHVTADTNAETVTFSLTFDRVPVLQTYDGNMNAADEFAIDILRTPVTTPSLYGFGGEDLRLLSSTYRDLTVSANAGRTPTPLGMSALTTPRFSGSELLSLLPFQLQDTTVTIVAPFSALGETDGLFEAVIRTYRWGAVAGPLHEIGTVHGETVFGGAASAVPEPASVGVLGLAAVGLLLRRKREIRNSK
jgi:hypothetical protein